MEGEAGEEESDGDEDRWAEIDREDEGEDGAEHPGEGRVEEEAGFAGVPGGGDVPVGVEGAVAELVCGVEPALEVEGEVLAGGGAVEEERVEDEEDGEGDEEVCALGGGGWRGGGHGLL